MDQRLGRDAVHSVLPRGCGLCQLVVASLLPLSVLVLFLNPSHPFAALDHHSLPRMPSVFWHLATSASRRFLSEGFITASGLLGGMSWSELAHA